MTSFPNAHRQQPRPPRRGSMLCGGCKRTIARIKSTSGGWGGGPRPERFGYQRRHDRWAGAHHSEDGELVAAIELGCYICHPIFESSPSKLRPFAEFFHTFYEIQRSGDERWSVQFTIEITESIPGFGVEPQVIECYGIFKILPRSTIPQASGNFGGLPKDMSSRACKQQVQNWFKTCCTTHGPCKEDWRTSTYHPMRLLNIGADQMRLQCFRTGEFRPKYVTLSHCWDHDSVSTLRLLSQNIDELERGFELSTLPKQFRDAAEIAGWIGVKYIWIDALCIIQDSNKDWQQQSSFMGDIYAGSYCNIAATDGNENTGCLKERRLEVVEPFYVSHPEEDSSELTHVIGYDDIWCNSLLNTRLHNRAWVLQERQLSPRTIHFGEQIFWECRSHKACEAYPKGLPSEFTNRRTETWRQGEQVFNSRTQTQLDLSQQTWLGFLRGLLWWATQQPSSKPVPHEEIFKTWSIIVQRYMECSLTKPSDKLVAIAGLAKKVRETTGDRYLAGLWENKDLAPSLLWYIASQRRADGRPSIRFPSLGKEGYRAPSWSWASADARISWNWPAKCGQLLINIEKTVIHATQELALGAVEGAEMVLRGYLIPARLEILHIDGKGRPDEDGSYAVLPSSGGYDPCEDFEWLAGPALDPEPTVYLDVAMAPKPVIDVHLLPVCTEWRGRSGHVVADVAGLILQQRPLGGKTVYERLGVYGLDWSSLSIIAHGLYEHRDEPDGIFDSMFKESLTIV